MQPTTSRTSSTTRRSRRYDATEEACPIAPVVRGEGAVFSASTLELAEPLRADRRGARLFTWPEGGRIVDSLVQPLSRRARRDLPLVHRSVHVDVTASQRQVGRSLLHRSLSKTILPYGPHELSPSACATSSPRARVRATPRTTSWSLKHQPGGRTARGSDGRGAVDVRHSRCRLHLLEKRDDPVTRAPALAADRLENAFAAIYARPCSHIRAARVRRVALTAAPLGTDA